MTTATQRWRREYRRSVLAGLVAGVALALVVAWAFARPGTDGGRRITVEVASANQLRDGSEVRTAGIPIGTVDRIDPGDGDTARLVLRIRDEAPVLRVDARFSVKPRLLLEGNGYVDVRPGTPTSAALRDGDVVPLSQSDVAVQTDQVLGAFDLPTRESLHRAIDEMASGLGSDGGRPAGAVALRRAVGELRRALPPARTSLSAMRGVEPGDLPRAVRGAGSFARELVRDPRALADVVSSIDRISRTLAVREAALGSAVHELASVTESAPRDMRAISEALPRVDRMVRALRPTLRTAPRALRAVPPLAREVRRLVAPERLPALLDRLLPVTERLPTVLRRTDDLLRRSTPVTNCIVTHIVPTLNMRIEDERHSTGDPVWLDGLHFATGTTALSSAVDGNAGTARLGVTVGTTMIDGILPGIGDVTALVPGDVRGINPRWLGYGVDPAYRPDRPCAEQDLPDLQARKGGVPDWITDGRRRDGTR
ncbi:MAG: MlaD family protein [Solirubrobacteraceae bacterium]